MQIITKHNAIINLQKYKGICLAHIAKQYYHDITIVKNNKQNKGWKGLVLERLAGLQNNTSKAPNGIGFELKTISFHLHNNKWLPKETMAITMLNKQQLKNTHFFNSCCWNKLKSLIICAITWEKQNDLNAKLLEIKSFDLFTNDKLITTIKHDYELIRKKFITSGILSSRDGLLIQNRTKGTGHGSTSRAFYARKKLITQIFNN
jgi:DNA mismatch repair protein MutH